MEIAARTEKKSLSPLFSLYGSGISALKSGFPIGELRELGKEVKASHVLRGALRMIQGEWVLGIKIPTRAIAENMAPAMCFRWDGSFGSAITMTIGSRNKGWVARAWIWSEHPAVEALRMKHGLTVVTIYNGEPISVVQMKANDASSERGIDVATDKKNEAERRSAEHPVEKDEDIAYWEIMGCTPTWNHLLSTIDFLRIGWANEFREGLNFATSMIGSETTAPAINESDQHFWNESGHQCPQEFWDNVVLPLSKVIRGETSILEFIRTDSALSILLVLADDSLPSSKNPLSHLGPLIYLIAEISLLADTRTQYGCRVMFSDIHAKRRSPIAIPIDGMTIDDAKKYWANIPSVVAIDAGELISTSMQPADLDAIIIEINSIKIDCSDKEADEAISAMTEEANILNRWTIPWGARVQTNIGPFTEITFFPHDDEISILLRTPSGDYRWAAFNLRTNAWNLGHVFTNRFELMSERISSEHNASNIKRAFKLILASIVRDFVVLEDRESAFAVRRETASNRKSVEDDGPRIVYIPRINYLRGSPDIKNLETELDYGTRRPHHVRAHQRRVDTSSPFQRILAQRYGFRLEAGFTFVRPHQRGGIAPDREVIYRSRSAMQSLFGVDSSIESNGSSNWFQFERDVYDVMASAGFKVDHVASSKNGDAGVDVFAENKSATEFWAIQCKCYAPSRKIGPSTIREIIGALAAYPSGTKGMVVTTSSFTSGAIELAHASGITLGLLAAGATGQAVINFL
jgi:hypothetical protein